MIELNSSRNLTVHRRARRILGVFVLVALLTTSAYAQTFEVLKEFDATGYNPRAPLIQGPDGILYGTAQSGGTAGSGVVFTIHPDGTGYNVLWNFSGGNDGGNPYAGLLLSGSTLYGTTYSGGSNSLGTVFAINTDGSGFTNLYSFTGGPDGANPCGGLVLSGGRLYGTAEEGGDPGFGTVFAVNTDGSGFTNLYSFTGGNDCGNPYASLIISGSTLYGTTAGISPQIAYYGSVFSINTNGGGFTLLKVFKGPDGANPYGALVLFGSTLYGTTGSGNPGWGTVFAVNTNGTGFTNFYQFTGTTDGCYPYGTLVLSGGRLYGTTSGGYDYEGLVYGTIFSVNISGSDFTNIYSFTDGSDGGTPYAGLTLSGNTLFGTAYAGGLSGYGALFALTLSGPPIITNQPLSQVVLPGSTVTLSVGCVGVAPLTYQWALNGVGLPEATNATLTLTNASFADSGGAYSVLITNIYFNLQLQADTAGSVESSTAVITVLPAIAITQPASGLSVTGAMLNGSVTIGLDETVAWFDWGTDTNYGNIAEVTIMPGNNGSNYLSTTLGGLPGNFYHYRIVAANDFGIIYGNDQSFTVGLAPTVTTLAAVNSANGSTLNAAVNPNGWDTTVYFRWGTLALTNVTPVIDIGAGATALNVSSFITGLASAARYNYQVVASNNLGTRSGTSVAFYSPPFVTVPGEDWTSVAASADGSVMVAVANPGSTPTGPIYISTNSGSVWNQATNAPLGRWQSVACSADGSKIVAVQGGGYGTLSGPIYTSADTGTTWVSNNTPVHQSWESVASSADGTNLVAADLSARMIYTSANAGATWSQATNAPKVVWYSLASSADGSKLAAVANGSANIYMSTNFGATWMTNIVPAGPFGVQNNWTAIASSADGSKLVAAGGGYNSLGNLFVSTNFGTSWTLTATNVLPSHGRSEWIYVASSADGRKLAAVSESSLPGGVITSTDSGATWTTNAVPNLTWNAVALSADGARMVVTVGYPSYVGPIYTTQTTPSPALNLSASDNETVISWIIPSLNFTLQQSPDLLNWTDVTNLPVLNLTNLQNQVVLPPPDGNNFFRLFH